MIEIRDELTGLLVEAGATRLAGWLDVARTADEPIAPAWLSGQGGLSIGIGIGIALERAGDDAMVLPWSVLDGHRDPAVWPQVGIALIGFDDFEGAALRRIAERCSLLVVGDCNPCLAGQQAVGCHLDADRCRDLELLAEAGWPL